MASTRETVIAALFDTLENGVSFRLLRNEAVPQSITGGSLGILRDGEPGEPEVMLSPLTYEYNHQAEIELFADAEDVDAAFDAAAVEIGTVIQANRTLGGACDWVEPMAIESGEDIPIEGGSTVKAAIIPIILVYTTENPLN